MSRQPNPYVMPALSCVCDHTLAQHATSPSKCNVLGCTCNSFERRQSVAERQTDRTRELVGSFFISP